MKTLITGCSGLLGSYLLKTAPAGNLQTDGMNEVYAKRFDITDPAAVNAAFIEVQPNLVIHCAGESRVDHAEKDPRNAWRLNVHGTQNILDAAAHYQAHVVFISSNAVYRGDTPPYSEDDECRPVNVYGKTKLEAERLLLCYPYKGTIIRPIFLYGWVKDGGRKNMDTRVLEALRKGESMKVVTDVFTQPTYAQDCANMVWQMAFDQKAIKEKLNVAGPEKMSLYDFAVAVAKAFDLDASKIQAATSAEFSFFAPRPKDTTFDLKKLSNFLGNYEMAFLKVPKSGLARMRKERE